MDLPLTTQTPKPHGYGAHVRARDSTFAEPTADDWVTLRKPPAQLKGDPVPEGTNRDRDVRAFEPLVDVSV